MVEEYLNTHKDTIVINIACGLDTRCYRMKGKYVRWYNLDLPETINIRKQFLKETGPIYQIAKSAMDESYRDNIQYHSENILVIIEGLTMYLSENDIKKMFSIIDFKNSTVMVEVMVPFVVKHIKEKSIEGSHAKFTWGIKNGKELEKFLPTFSFLTEVSLVEGMKKLMPIYHVLGKIPFVYNIRIVSEHFLKVNNFKHIFFNNILYAVKNTFIRIYKYPDQFVMFIISIYDNRIVVACTN